jgi:uncharacterized membrane protein
MSSSNRGVKICNIHSYERWLSVLGGGMLAIAGLRKGSTRGTLMALAGTELLRRGLTGQSYAYQAFGVRTAERVEGASVSLPYELGVSAKCAVTIGKSREEVFRFWRNLENLPRFMKHLKSVTALSPSRSHWVAEGPGGKTVEWDAEIINEVENQLIGWRSLGGSEVESAGSVHFKTAPGDRGTEIFVELQYNPPAGAVGAAIAKLFGRDGQSEIESDLLRLKQYLEAGEIASTEGQSKGPKISKTVRKQRKPMGRTAQPIREVAI